VGDISHVTTTPCRRCIRVRFTVAPRFFSRLRIHGEAAGGGEIAGCR
jgi:hypothetical protein